MDRKNAPSEFTCSKFENSCSVFIIMSNSALLFKRFKTSDGFLYSPLPLCCRFYSSIIYNVMSVYRTRLKRNNGVLKSCITRVRTHFTLVERSCRCDHYKTSVPSNNYFTLIINFGKTNI